MKKFLLVMALVGSLSLYGAGVDNRLEPEKNQNFKMDMDAAFLPSLEEGDELQKLQNVPQKKQRREEHSLYWIRNMIGGVLATFVGPVNGVFTGDQNTDNELSRKMVVCTASIAAALQVINPSLHNLSGAAVAMLTSQGVISCMDVPEEEEAFLRLQAAASAAAIVGIANFADFAEMRLSECRKSREVRNSKGGGEVKIV